MIRYELREGKNGMGTIQVRMVGKGVNTKVSTGIKIKVKEWSAEAQTLRHGSDVRPVASLGGLSYNALGERLTELRRILEVLDDRGEATADNVKVQITDVLKEKSCVKTVDTSRGCFVRFMEQYIIDMENGVRTKKKTHEKVRDYYPKKFETVKKHLEGYQEKNGVDIGWGSLTKSFFDKFCVYLQDLGLTQNTIANYTTLLAIIVKEAISRKLVTCDTDIEEWSVAHKEVDKIALSNEKLEELYEVNFLDKDVVRKYIDQARDEDKEFVKKALNTYWRRRMCQRITNIFLLCCFTGQRYSDYEKVKNGVVCQLADGREYIRIKQQKGGKNLFIPLDPRAKNVMGRDIVSLSNAAMNRNIKRIGRILGWTEKTSFTEEINGIKYPSQKKYYEYLESHTARRTFASLMYKRGVNLQAIMAVTGHSSERMLKKYIRVEEEEKAMMASMEMFKITLSREA